MDLAASVLCVRSLRHRLGRTLEFDKVAFRIPHVHARTIAIGACSHAYVEWRHASLLEIGAEFLFIEGIYPQANMMHVVAFIARRSAAFAAEPAIGAHEVDHGSAGAHLYQAVFLAMSLDATTEYVAIELNGPR